MRPDACVVHHGDCLDVLRGMPEASVDAVVTDPPYGLEFMGKEWDKLDGYSGGNPNIKPSDKHIRATGEGEWQPGRTYGAPKRNPRCRRCGKLQRGNGACKCAAADWDTRHAEQGFRMQVWHEAWAREVYRVMKPGAHLVAFGGTRTYHRMACAIEDAGFEVRDQLAWITGQGFPKSLNVSNALYAEIACCCHKNSLQSHHASETHGPLPEEGVRHLPRRLAAGEQVSAHPQPDVLAGLLGGAYLGSEKGTLVGASVDPVRNLRDTRASAAIPPEEADTGVLLGLVPERDVRGAVPGHCPQGGRGQDAGELREGCNEGQQEPGMEGRRHLHASPGELRLDQVRPVSLGVPEHGPEGRVRDGAPAGDGAVGRQAAPAGRVRASRGPRPHEQSEDQPVALAGQPQPQDGGAWPHCGRCGKPIVPDGLGTALKPAHEPIVLARKPLAEPTVAANVLEHGTGALNIDACRVPHVTVEGGTLAQNTHLRASIRAGAGFTPGLGTGDATREEIPNPAGRWPPNLVHSGEPEVLDAFATFGERRSSLRGPNCGQNGGNKTGNGIYSDLPQKGYAPGTTYGDTGTAARFFPALGFGENELRFMYSAKASRADRCGSKHPTVKPVALMRWLCRLITPPGGTVLDCFAGSGTTGEAALAEGFSAIMIEREAEYYNDILARLRAAKETMPPLFAFNSSSEQDAA